MPRESVAGIGLGAIQVCRPFTGVHPQYCMTRRELAVSSESEREPERLLTRGKP